MRSALAAVALLCASCIATSGDLERAVTDISERVSVVARSAEESAEAAREAYRQGSISYAELQQRLQDIRAATLDVAQETAKEVIGDLRETLEKRPAVVAETGAAVAREAIPGPWGDLLGGLLIAGGTYMAAARRAKEEAARVNKERDLARMKRGERTGETPQ